MPFKRTASSVLAFTAAGALAPIAALAQSAVPTTTGPTITVSQSSVNVLNLLAPYLTLDATTVGQQTLSANLAQSISINNNATAAQQALAVSDKNLFGGLTNTITLANGSTATYGIAANLAGGLPAQAAVNPAPNATTTTPTTPIQPVGGLGPVLGAIYQQGVQPGMGPLIQTETLLNTAYGSFTSRDLGVAKNYFANGAANNTPTYAKDNQTVVSAVTNPIAAPTGFTLPTANGLPNNTNSIYDFAYGVTKYQPNQDVFGSSRPTQVSGQINNFDSTSLNQIAGNPSFPSGHTTYAYTDSILIGMLVPSEYQNMLSRGSEYANSRIVLGVHYPLDIIASRALASYDLSQAFTNAAYQNGTATTASNFVGNFNLLNQFVAARNELTAYIQASPSCAGMTVAACANSAANTTNNPYVPSAANLAIYTANLTYGLPTLTFAQAPREGAPAGGPDASILLAPLFGGSTVQAQTIAPGGGTLAALSTNTINQIIVNTETNALAAFYGTPLSYWTRINLYAAAGYFGNVVGNTTLATTDVVNTPVTINATGALENDGMIDGTIVINSGGALSGSGTVGTVAAPTTMTVNAGGVLSGGTAAAQAAIQSGGGGRADAVLAVNGNVNFAPGATYAVSASPTQVTSVAASGTATLTGASVSVTQSSIRPYTDSRLIFSAAGGLNGTFAGVTSNLLFATPSLSYDPNTNVFLSFGNPNFLAAGGTQNEQAIGAALNRGAANNVNAPLIAALGTLTRAQGAQALAAFDSLSGEGLTAAQNSAHQQSSEFTSSIFDQLTFYGAGAPGVTSVTLNDPFAARAGYAPIRELADLPATQPAVAQVAPPPRTWRVWSTGFGGNERLQGSAVVGSAAQNDQIYGGTVAVDYQVTPDHLIGIAGGGSSGNFNVPGRATAGSTTGGHVGIYDLANFGAFYGASSVSGSFFNNRTTRNVAGVGGLAGETDLGRFGSDEIRARLEGGRHFGLASGAITPFVALEIAELHTRAFAETNFAGPTNFGLAVPSQTNTSVPSFVGARYQGLAVLPNGFAFVPSLQLAWVHEFAPQRNLFGTFINLPGATFLVNGARPSYNAAQVKAGGELRIGPHAELFATFDGEFSGLNQFYGGKGGFIYAF